jgi:hypothetical protein
VAYVLNESLPSLGVAKLPNTQRVSIKMAASEESDSFNLSDFDVYESDKDKLYLSHGSSEDGGMCITLYSCLNPEILGCSYLSVTL